MRSGCRRGGSLRTLAWRAVQMEGPGCLRTTGLVVRLAPFGVLALWGQLLPDRSLVEVGPSAALRARSGEGQAQSWGSPSYDPDRAPTWFLGLLAGPYHMHKQPRVEERL